jgi:hypothetical protein
LAGPTAGFQVWEKKSLCAAAEERKTPGRPAHIEVSGGFPENIGRFREAVKRFCNFFHSNLFGKKLYFSFTGTLYPKRRVTITLRFINSAPRRHGIFQNIAFLSTNVY